VKYIAIVSAALGLVLLYLLSTASANTDFFSRNYPLLLGLNLALAVGLMLLIAIQLRVLLRKLRNKVFGARLTLRLVLMFGLMAVLPGVLVYSVSVQFLTKSIESWFDVRVDNALEGGLNLGRTALEHLLQDLRKKGQAMALALSDQPTANYVVALNNLREQMGVQEADLFNQNGKLLAFSGNENSGMQPELPDSSVMRQIRLQKPYSAIESLPGRGLYLRVVVPVNVLSLSEDTRVLQLLQPVPPRLSQDAQVVQEVYRDYQQLSLSRQGLKRISALTLTLTLLLAMLSAIALAFVLSDRLSAPLGILAAGTRAIAKGDFIEMPEVRGLDELGMLTQSFNSMTRQLADAKAAAEFNQQQLEAAKIYLESILANLSAGVLAFDQHFRVRTANPSAGQILGVDLPRLRGFVLREWKSQDSRLEPFAREILAQFEPGGAKEWQRQIEYEDGSHSRILLIRGTRLPVEVDSGYIVVFDEITHLLQAQRDAAWGEVARRLAHEIKNPLTPIQLSAERLQHKLADKLSPPETDMLARSTQTIINQVAALKKMVAAFSEYARSPQLKLQTLDLNQLVQEVLTLYESMGGRYLTLDLAPSLPPLLGDVTLLRQVIHNLLQNAQDAIDETGHPRIHVQTCRDGDGMRFDISDNGGGFPEHLMKRLFEPYVTTKPKGTGLGLAIVKKIVEEHHGVLRAENLAGGGARVSVWLPAAASEKEAKEI